MSLTASSIDDTTAKSASENEVLNKREDLAKTIQGAIDELKDEHDANETISKIINDLGAGQSHDKVLQKNKKKFKSWFFSWMTDQMNNLGRGVVALLVAGAVAFLTPLLVNLQVSDSIERYTGNVSELIQSQNTLPLLGESAKVSEEALLLAKASAAEMESILVLQSHIAQEQESGVGVLEKLVDEQRALANDIVRLEQLVKALPSGAVATSELGAALEASRQTSRLVLLRIEKYLAQTQRLLTQASLDSKRVDALTTEVYYFVTMLPIEENQAYELKEELKKITRKEKDYSDERYRIERTEILLSALKSRIELPIFAGL